MDKLKISYRDLDSAETLALLRSHDTAMTGNTNYPAPVPNAAAATAMITRLNGATTAFASNDAAWDAAKAELENATAAAQGLLGQRAGACNASTPGDKAKLVTTGLPLIAEHTPAGATPRVMNLKLTVGDLVGYIDPSWDSLLKKASSYEVQSALAMGNDPNAATWAPHAAVTKSNSTIGPFTSGARVWVRVRAIGTTGPGDWSDPATMIVP